MVSGLRPTALALLLAACSTSSPAGGGIATPTPEPTSAFDLRTPEELLASSQPVSFPASDGVGLEGRLFGEGDVAVVLAHMGGQDDDQSQWFETAGLLAEQGYEVLTYNRRGVCPGGDQGCSEGQEDGDGWRDLVGAVHFLRKGAGTVVIGGASLGAMEAMYVAGRSEAEIDGLIWAAGAQGYGETDLVELAPRVLGPKLYLAGEFDQDLGDLARDLHGASREPKELVLLDTGEHGTDIPVFDEPPIADGFRQAILDFLDSHFA